MADSAAALLALAGCGKPAAVLSGNVSFEGQPIENGSITLIPDDGRGPVCGGKIEKGHYRLEVVKPGKKIVQIVGVKKVNFAVTSEEMAEAAKDKTRKPDATGIVDRADIIPSDAEGNNVVVEVAAGQQTMDFQLKKPPRKQASEKQSSKK